MLTLGQFDVNVSPDTVNAYLARVVRATGLDLGDKLRGDKDGQLVAFQRTSTSEEMTVTQVQQFLKDAGFFPLGTIDGIFGYRTTAALRLFQEYVRTVDNDSTIGSPDGQLGPKGFACIKRWQQSRKRANWITPPNTPNYDRGLQLLTAIKQRCAAKPSKMLQMVNGFSGNTDTLKVAEWDFNPNAIHLIGVRKSTRESQEQFNDIFFLLIRGLVFTFFGSTDPGASDHPAGAPFLTSGQHVYRFGWHKMSDQKRVYQALKPRKHGVLVVRSKNDRVLTDSDLAGGLSANLSINIHWGGEGFNKIGKWSEGCQVITGKAYINHENKLIDLAKYAASFYDKLGTSVNGNYQTKGAYTVLADLAASFSGDQDNTVRYMLLTDDELAVNPDLKKMIDEARQQFGTIKWA